MCIHGPAGSNGQESRGIHWLTHTDLTGKLSANVCIHGPAGSNGQESRGIHWLTYTDLTGKLSANVCIHGPAGSSGQESRGIHWLTHTDLTGKLSANMCVSMGQQAVMGRRVEGSTGSLTQISQESYQLTCVYPWVSTRLSISSGVTAVICWAIHLILYSHVVHTDFIGIQHAFYIQSKWNSDEILTSSPKFIWFSYAMYVKFKHACCTILVTYYEVHIKCLWNSNEIHFFFHSE